MENYSLLLSNRVGEDPCNFWVNLKSSVIDCLHGEWWMGMVSIKCDYSLVQQPETIYISTDIIKPVPFANRVKRILSTMDGGLKAVNYYEQQVQYIKLSSGLHNFIHIEITNEAGQPLKSMDTNPVTLMLLNIKGILPPEIEENEDGSYKLDWLD